MIDFLIESTKLENEIISTRRRLHKNAELGFSETDTSKIVREYLDKYNIPYYICAKTGIVGLIEGNKSVEDNESLDIKPKVVALRADMDALPILEENDVSYKSKNAGIMHACGHDGHMAILLSAAKILKKYSNEFNGFVKIIFEPAEETVGGSKVMIEENVLENPHVDAVFGLHVTENLETNKIMLRSKFINAASNTFTIKIMGKGAHGATPDISIDPIVISSQIITAIQTISSRKISPKNPVVVTVVSIHGGSAKNVIPKEVVIKGIIRTTNENDRKIAKESLYNIAHNICIGHGATSEIQIDDGYPSLYNDEEMCSKLINAAKKVIGSSNVLYQKEISMGVESFAYFASKVPSCFYYVGTGNKAKNTTQPAHSSKFNIDEEALKIGCAIQCQVAFDFLTNNILFI